MEEWSFYCIIWVKIKFLGSGGAFTTAEKNYHSNILIYDESKDYLLFDAGTDIKDSLNAANIKPTDIITPPINNLNYGIISVWKK